MIKISKESLKFLKERINFYSNESYKLIFEIYRNHMIVNNYLKFEKCKLSIKIPITQTEDAIEKKIIVSSNILKILNVFSEAYITVKHESLLINNYRIPYKEIEEEDIEDIKPEDQTGKRNNYLFTISSEEVKKGINTVMIRKSEDYVYDRVLIFYSKEKITIANFTWEHSCSYTITNNFHCDKEKENYEFILAKFPIKSFKDYEMKFSVRGTELKIESVEKEKPLMPLIKGGEIEEDYKVIVTYGEYAKYHDEVLPITEDVCTINRNQLLEMLKEANIIDSKIKMIIKNGYVYIKACDDNGSSYFNSVAVNDYVAKEDIQISNINSDRLITIIKKMKDTNIKIGVLDEKIVVKLSFTGSKLREVLLI